MRGDFRDLHQPGLEHGLLLLSVAAHACRATWTRSRASFHLTPLAEILAARGALRRARPDLEHDDVDVGRLVLRRRLGGDHRRRHHHHPAGRRLLSSPPPTTTGDGTRSSRRWSTMARRHSALRPTAVPPDHRLGGQVPRRAVGRRSRSNAPGCSICLQRTHWIRLGVRPSVAALRSAALLAARACLPILPRGR